MMKMLVVEDETILREGICLVGDWEKYNIEISGAVSNGKEALEQIAINQPDIILTDVVMPIMDGIELTKRVYEQYPQIRVILLSGHEEFEFVKKAMQYKASDYLLKPAKIEKLIEVLSKVCDEIETERKRLAEEERLQKKLEQSTPILREQYMNQLLVGMEYEEEHIQGQFEFLNIDLDTKNIAVLLCEMDMEAEKRMQSRIAMLQLRELCYEIVREEYQCVVFEDLKDRMVIILNYPENLSAKEILPYLQGKAIRIQKEMVARTGHFVSLGIGRFVKNIRYLSKVYKEAEDALAYRFFMGQGSVIYIGDIEKEDHKDWLILLGKEEELAECIKAGDIVGVNQQMEQYFQLLGQFSALGQEFIFEKITAFISYLLRFMGIKAVDGESNLLLELEGLSEDLRRKMNCTTLSELENKVSMVVIRLTEDINQNRILRNEGIIEKAQKYIKQNISKDVSLITVADSVYVSPNYLSFLFKESGENFKDYVVRVKMEQAKEMIDAGTYNLNQIALMLGYKDGRYLSQVYKKYYEK
ncbi:response regulator [Anaerosporobacter sp.]|uniref:response regulator n=1 Tax=Anaerosporobacter sp. TaxID=1872529 RepID=UPI00286F8E97|nr:response regulator [Anaerosporobacter sp.]